MVGRTNVGRMRDRAPAHAIMGFEWDFSNPSPVLVRLGNAAGLTATASIGTVAGHSDFDEMPIYKDIRRCNLRANGTVAAYEGEQNFTFTPPTGIDVMVEIPAFYYMVENDPVASRYRCFISNQQSDGFALHPAFNRPTGPVDKNYVAAYSTSAGNRSISGTLPLVSQRRSAFRTGARNKGAGWGIQDLAARMAINMLMTIEFANLNLQAVIGAGNTGGVIVALAAGQTDSVVGSGRAAGTNPAVVSVVWRGSENLWGNHHEWVDGLNIDNGLFFVSTNPAHYADDTRANYTQLSFSTPTNIAAGVFATRYGFDPAAPWANLPQGFSGGSETTFLCDGAFASIGWRAVSVGGGWGSHGFAGPFCWEWQFASTLELASVGSRLMYIPQ